MPRKSILTVKGLTKKYGAGCKDCLRLTGPGYNTNICPVCGTVVALHDVNFEMYEGEILGIVGESGSGKSSLMQILYFDQEATAGEMYLSNYADGKENVLALPSNKKRFIRNHVLGMVYQNPLKGLSFNISCGGNVAEKLLVADINNFGFIRAKGTELLERTEIAATYMDQKPKRLSGGMQQRVQIAKAMANNPAILLLDEVTTGLDVSVQAKVLDLIKNLQKASGTSMIVVSHDLGVIRLLTNRTLVFKNGRMIEGGLTDQILEDPQHEYTQLLVHSTL